MPVFKRFPPTGASYHINVVPDGGVPFNAEVSVAVVPLQIVSLVVKIVKLVMVLLVLPLQPFVAPFGVN